MCQVGRSTLLYHTIPYNSLQTAASKGHLSKRPIIFRCADAAFLQLP